MNWECSECGGRLMRQRPPLVCPECGTAGATFVEADPDLEDEAAQSFARAAWLRHGLQSGEFIDSYDGWAS